MAESVGMVTMMTLRTTQIRSRRRILQRTGPKQKNRASLVVAKVEEVASSPETETCSTPDPAWPSMRPTHQWMTRNRCSTLIEQNRALRWVMSHCPGRTHR